MQIDDHPLLDAAVLRVTLPRPLGELPSPSWLLEGFGEGYQAPLSTGPEVKLAVRDLLRHGGFKPSGRNKPASEYLLKAVAKGWLCPTSSINAAVDACNVVSLHSGLPISVVDEALGAPPWRIGLCPEGAEYVFNPSGQTLRVGGLLALFDEEGPCAGPVKDSQRTKTSESTTDTLWVIWGTRALPGRARGAQGWLVELLERVGASAETLVEPA